MTKQTIPQKLDAALDETFPASDPISVAARPQARRSPPAQVFPGELSPQLVLPTTGGELWSLHERSPEAFTMLVAYRGLHCPVCAKYLRTLQRLTPRYRERGVEPFAFSMDTRERAQESAEKWGVDAFEVGYGLTEDIARRWGLFISHRTEDAEPERFSEPGLFLVRPDATLHYASIQSMPFGRPDLEGMLDAIDFVKEHAYPPRGRVAA